LPKFEAEMRYKKSRIR